MELVTIDEWGVDSSLLVTTVLLRLVLILGRAVERGYYV